MKKFIAGVVLTVVAFMALTTGALAGRNSSGNGGYNDSGKNCTSWEYDTNTTCYRHGNW
jgi:hypothetical protein